MSKRLLAQQRVFNIVTPYLMARMLFFVAFAEWCRKRLNESALHLVREATTYG